jgi:hypothetical protein
MDKRLHWHKSIEGLYNQKLEESLGPSGTEQIMQRMAEKVDTPRQLRKMMKSKSQNELFTSDLGIEQGSKEQIIFQLKASQVCSIDIHVRINYSKRLLRMLLISINILIKR